MKKLIILFSLIVGIALLNSNRAFCADTQPPKPTLAELGGGEAAEDILQIIDIPNISMSHVAGILRQAHLTENSMAKNYILQRWPQSEFEMILIPLEGEDGTFIGSKQVLPLSGE